MTSPDTEINRGNLLFRLGLLTRRWRQVLDAEIQASGLTDATWRPLLHLSLLGDGTRQKDLASSLGLEGPSIVRLLDTLLAKGLIHRTEDATDRRAKLLYLTAEGRILVDRIQTAVLRLENGLLGSFTDPEIAQIAHFIERLESTINETRRPCKP